MASTSDETDMESMSISDEQPGMEDNSSENHYDESEDSEDSKNYYQDSENDEGDSEDEVSIVFEQRQPSQHFLAVHNEVSTAAPRTDDREWDIEWYHPLQQLCQTKKLNFHYFNLAYVREAFNRNIIGTMDDEILLPARNVTESRLKSHNALQEFHLFRLASRFPSQALTSVLNKLRKRQKELEKNKTAVYTQNYGHIFEMNWSETSRIKKFAWNISVKKTSTFKPPEVYDAYARSHSVVYTCKPFMDDLDAEMGEREDLAQLLLNYTAGDATLLSVGDITYSFPSVYSILAPEIAQQLTSYSIGFVDINNGMVLWNGSSKISKPMFYVEQFTKRLII